MEPSSPKRAGSRRQKRGRKRRVSLQKRAPNQLSSFERALKNAKRRKSGRFSVGKSADSLHHTLRGIRRLPERTTSRGHPTIASRLHVKSLPVSQAKRVFPRFVLPALQSSTDPAAIRRRLELERSCCPADDFLNTDRLSPHRNDGLTSRSP